MECISVEADWIFEIFTRGNRETDVFLLDVRPYKFFKRQHIQQSFCVRRTADKDALAVRFLIRMSNWHFESFVGLLKVTV